MKSKEQLMNDIKIWKKDKLYQDIVNNNKKVLICDDNESLIEELVDDIIMKRDIRGIIQFVRNVSGISIEELTDKVIETEDTNYIYYFARNIKDAPIGKLTAAVIASQRVDYIYLFAKDVDKAPIETLADIIIESQDVDHIYYFIRDVKNAPIERMIEAVIRTYNMEKIWWLAKRLGISIQEFYQKYSKEKGFAVGLLMKNENKEEALTNLIDKMDQGDNLVKLRVYFDFLNNPKSSLDEARDCDLEYKEYIVAQRTADNKALKKATTN